MAHTFRIMTNKPKGKATLYSIVNIRGNFVRVNTGIHVDVERWNRDKENYLLDDAAINRGNRSISARMEKASEIIDSMVKGGIITGKEISGAIKNTVGDNPIFTGVGPVKSTEPKFVSELTIEQFHSVIAESLKKVLADNNKNNERTGNSPTEIPVGSSRQLFPGKIKCPVGENSKMSYPYLEEENRISENDIIHLTAKQLKCIIEEAVGNVLGKHDDAQDGVKSLSTMSMSEVCELLHIQRNAVYKLIRQGLLCPRKVVGRVLFIRSEVESLIKG